jgi:hypothetical protein
MFGDFRTHLKSLERAFAIDFWADTRIKPGYYWSEEIEGAIRSAELFVLLITPGFIASDYIFEREIPAIKERHRGAGALVIPVVLKRCFWRMVADVLQAVPTEQGQLKPVTDWRPQRDGLDCARDQMASSIEAYFGISAKTVGWKVS